MKQIVFDAKTKNKKNRDGGKKETEVKIREKITNFKKNVDFSNNIVGIISDHKAQTALINKLYLGENFIEKKFLLSELKTKINSYKQQDLKKDFHEKENLITLEQVINKLVESILKCYYCRKNMYLFFDKVRDNSQWTLDRLNNYDEHTNDNTIVCCLQCNLERRRKNSEKFKFSKQLETNQIKINKVL
jgi:hypothetical protein